LHALVTARAARKGATIAILGLAFKPGVPILDASPGVALARRLAQGGYRVLAHDPMVGTMAHAELREGATVVQDVESCLRRSDVAVIATPWSEYRRLDAALFQRPGGGLPVIDCWSVLTGTPAGAAARHIRLGVGPASGGSIDGAERGLS
jgi:UDP-N-acetyl-D-mannosaminuronate dehydrogenase